MSVSGPSPLGTLMVQRVEAALGVTVSQQANIAAGARPDAVTQPGQPDKTEALKNPPPKDQEGARHSQGRQSGLAALARNDPEIARLLAARNAPMTSYTASAPTSLGQAAKTILALLQQFPDARPAVAGRAPLLAHPPGQGGSAAAGHGAAGATAGSAATTPPPVGGNLDPRAVEALMQRAAGGSTQTAASNQTATTNPAGTNQTAENQAAATNRGTTTTHTGTAAQTGTTANTAAALRAGMPTAQPSMALPGQSAATGSAVPLASGLTTGSLPLLPTGMAGQLALALSHAMQSSGLFYESHLREFAFGQRSVAQMRGEPQAQAGREAGGGTQSGSTQARGTGEAAGSQTQQASQAAGQQSQTPTQTAAQTTQSSAHLAGALLSMDPSTHVLVRQQLETLANQAFAWQGEAWPGGDLEWEVRRREPQGDTEETDNWSTRLKLNLPGLGEVVARLSLSETQLVMHLAAPESAGLMADHTGLLRERLNLHGLQLSQLTISRESGSDEGQEK